MAFLFAARCKSNARLDDKTAIITGANTGIGLATAKDFYQRGCHVIMACRDVINGELAANSIREELIEQENCGELVVMRLDLASLRSVREFAQRILSEEPQLNILVNNAAVMFCPFSLSEDGFERHFATNHLGHFLLTLLLLPRLIRSAPSRIVIVTSPNVRAASPDFEDINWEKSTYDAGVSYARSKLASLIFMMELSRQLKEKNVKVYAVHPGWTQTDLDRHMDLTYFAGYRSILAALSWIFVKSPEQGAQTQIYCAVDEEAGESTGLYYENCRPSPFPIEVRTRTITEALWIRSVNMVKFRGNPFTAA